MGFNLCLPLEIQEAALDSLNMSFPLCFFWNFAAGDKGPSVLYSGGVKGFTYTCEQLQVVPSLQCHSSDATLLKRPCIQ